MSDDKLWEALREKFLAEATYLRENSKPPLLMHWTRGKPPVMLSADEMELAAAALAAAPKEG